MHHTWGLFVNTCRNNQLLPYRSKHLKISIYVNNIHTNFLFLIISKENLQQFNHQQKNRNEIYPICTIVICLGMVSTKPLLLFMNNSKDQNSLQLFLFVFHPTLSKIMALPQNLPPNMPTAFLWLVC